MQDVDVDELIGTIKTLRNALSKSNERVREQDISIRKKDDVIRTIRLREGKFKGDLKAAYERIEDLLAEVQPVELSAKRVYIWEKVEPVSNDYHNNGGLVIVADSLAAARAL